MVVTLPINVGYIHNFLCASSQKKIYALLTCGGSRMVQRLHIGQLWKSGLIFGKGRRYNSCKTSRPVMEPIQPTIGWVMEVKHLGHAHDH
jgi:hypothetical protein